MPHIEIFLSKNECNAGAQSAGTRFVEAGGRWWFRKSRPPDATYWHFKGINTNWKQRRTGAPDGPPVDDAQLAAAMRRAGLVGPEGGR